MRALAWTILAAGTMLVSGPVRAQTYDPSYPVCLQVYDIDGGYIECAYTSLAQCNASASGRAAQCVINPFLPPANYPSAYAMRHNKRAVR
jgi:Protein of unknown function (DUF3551)